LLAAYAGECATSSAPLRAEKTPAPNLCEGLETLTKVGGEECMLLLLPRPTLFVAPGQGTVSAGSQERSGTPSTADANDFILRPFLHRP
jgi:hypothetical protein